MKRLITTVLVSSIVATPTAFGYTIEKPVYKTVYTSQKAFTKFGDEKEAGGAQIVIGCPEDRRLRFYLAFSHIQYTTTPAAVSYTTEKDGVNGIMMSNLDASSTNWLTNNTGFPDEMAHSDYKVLKNISQVKAVFIHLLGKYTNKKDLGTIVFGFDVEGVDKEIARLKKICNR